MRELRIVGDYYIFRRHFFYKAHQKSIFDIEIFPGIIASFGEPKSKLRSKIYQLTTLRFSKHIYTIELVKEFLKRFHVKYIEHKHNGKKLGPVYKIIGNADKLIHGGYIAICENTSETRAAFVSQKSYDFWHNEFYMKSSISNDTKVLNTAIPILINMINKDQTLLKKIPHNDHRVFEEVIAEVFLGFGYSVELTKKTRDGGRDIIALKKENDINAKKTLIECKHWEDKIDVSVIRELIGVAISEEELPTGIILATTSLFTKDAKEIRINSAIKIDLERKDYYDILEWLKEYDAIQFSQKDINRYFDSLRLTI